MAHPDADKNGFPLLLTEDPLRLTKKKGCYLGPDQRAVNLTLSASACQAIRFQRENPAGLQVLRDLGLLEFWAEAPIAWFDPAQARVLCHLRPF